MQIEETIGHVINECESLISEDSYKEVKHFYEHGEYEMAFEGLALELMQLDRRPVNFDYKSWCGIIKEMKLDQESVFDAEFWHKFQEWERLR
jgi:hypothetical protein